MKKNFLFLFLMGLLVACDNHSVVDANSVDNQNKNDTTDTEADGKTIIEGNFCYMIQEMNELGEPVDGYSCMIFEKNMGSTYEEAFNSIKPELEALAQRTVNDEKDGVNYEADKWELRQIVRKVKNAPNDKLTYVSIDLFMFSRVYNAYTKVYEYCIIDSEGNIYHTVLGEG